MNIQKVSAHAAEAEEFLKAIANRHRLMILCELHAGERCVSDLKRAVGIAQSGLSQHLAKLRAERLVVPRRDGQTIYYSLASQSVTKIMDLLHELYCPDDDRTKGLTGNPAETERSGENE
jgi:DNA-binding transcriptional ArsR family regulator